MVKQPLTSSKPYWLLVALGVLLVNQPSTPVRAQTPPLTINTEEYPPFNYQNAQGVVVGIATQQLRNALHHAGIDATFRLRPWARAYTEAKLREHHCVYSTTRTAEREQQFHWVGPLVINEWSAFGLVERQLNVSQLSELHAWRVGSFREDAVGDYVSQQGIDVLRAPTERENMARLAAGLLDVIVTGRATGEYFAQEQALAMEHLFTFYYAPLYLACHPSIERSLIERLQSHLDTPPPSYQELWP
ncbi:transporter substrate-binding domain-containing protein [Halomonas sp. DWK9]|uniref:substrate-binding periplasmic protein n=1 Tax=Halomonas sp. DWK9 TaxID=3060155 RepID=UPI00287FBD7C|nr:transporter substrate-binding domain-containing protein [Halomonas sp. DWK9]